MSEREPAALVARPWRCRLFGCDLPDVFINAYSDSRPRCRRCGREQAKVSETGADRG